MEEGIKRLRTQRQNRVWGYNGFNRETVTPGRIQVFYSSSSFNQTISVDNTVNEQDDKVSKTKLLPERLSEEVLEVVIRMPELVTRGASVGSEEEDLYLCTSVQVPNTNGGEKVGM